MKRLAVLGVVLIAFGLLISPRIAAAQPGPGCYCGKTVTLKGTVAGIKLTPDNHYYLLTDLSCGKGEYIGVNIKGRGNPPSSCKKLSFFTVSGSVDCKGVYELDIIPSKLICHGLTHPF